MLLLELCRLIIQVIIQVGQNANSNAIIAVMYCFHFLNLSINVLLSYWCVRVGAHGDRLICLKVAVLC